MGRIDATLRRFTGYRLRRASHFAMARFNTVFAAHGLRRTTFSALTLIVDNPGLRQAQLADALAIERPNLVQIVDELEAAGLVRRTPAEGDRRAYALQPTGRGRRVQQEAAMSVRACEDDLVRGLSEAQVAALHVALQHIEDRARGSEAVNDIQISRA